MSYFPKLNQLSNLIAIITYGAMLATIPDRAVANSRSDSNYQDSCWNTQVNGSTLFARCRRINGSSIRTSIPIRGIENRNGNLIYLSNSRSDSNYQNSCWNTQVNGSTLSARCYRINGSSTRTSISIRGIENRNGNLTYSR
jgi:CVNH domain